MLLCQHCGHPSRNKKLLKKHIEDVHSPDVKCSHCGKCLRPSSLQQHIQQTHPGPGKSNTVACEHCKKKFKHPNSLYRHMRQSHSGAPTEALSSSSCKASTRKELLPSHLEYEKKRVIERPEALSSHNQKTPNVSIPTMVTYLRHGSVYHNVSSTCVIDETGEFREAGGIWIVSSYQDAMRQGKKACRRCRTAIHQGEEYNPSKEQPIDTRVQEEKKRLILQSTDIQRQDDAQQPMRTSFGDSPLIVPARSKEAERQARYRKRHHEEVKKRDRERKAKKTELSIGYTCQQRA